MKICKWQRPDDYCMNLCEGTTQHCAKHNRMIRRISEQRKNESEKRELKMSKHQQPRTRIKKIGTTNTWLCSSGKRVTQEEINRNRVAAYNYHGLTYSTTGLQKDICQGCGEPSNSFAHIIAQARCKQIGKTELIWHLGNFFPSCFKCNSAIENPKGVAWHGLKNIGYCLTFIEQHDPELFAKFSSSGTLEL